MHDHDTATLLRRIAELEAQVAALQDELREAEFGNWLAGFIDGEGCFAIHKQTGGYGFEMRMQLALRADDRPILEEIRRRTGLGRVSNARRAPSGRGCPQAKWVVNSARDCTQLVALLDRCPLRAKKAADYSVWREAVHEWVRIPYRRRICSGPSRDWSRIEALHDALRKGRKYDGEWPSLDESHDPQMTLEG